MCPPGYAVAAWKLRSVTEMRGVLWRGPRVFGPGTYRRSHGARLRNRRPVPRTSDGMTPGHAGPLWNVSAERFGEIEHRKGVGVDRERPVVKA